MELIIKNFEKLSSDIQEDIQDFVAGYTSEFIVCDQTKAVADWRKGFHAKQGFLPDHIDLDKVLKLIETGEIDDQDLVTDLNQKTLEAFK